ncbi:MAG TPA: beta-propeller fold lactonase family protein [Solirubrobacterales bacterium]|nr:beta-propeller fold lactonase family protein [Solirubrobacterales bacterium]
MVRDLSEMPETKGIAAASPGGVRRLAGSASAIAVIALVIALCAPGAGAEPRALYVGDGVAGSPGALWQFSLRAGGLPLPLPSPAVAAGEDAKHIALTADGRFAYATGGADGLVYAYRVLPGLGRLAPLPVTPPNAGVGAHGVAVSPSGDAVYVAAQETATVSQYGIDPRTGALQPMQPASLPAGAGASGVAITPDGGSAYVTNLEANSIDQYDIDPGTGALSPKSPATVRVPGRPGGVGVSPDGRSLYAATLAGRLYQFTIAPRSGRLLPKRPLSVPVELGAAGIAITPDGRFLYVPNAGKDTVSQFAIDPLNGALTPLSPATVPVDSQPEGVALSPDGRSLYVEAEATGTVQWFRVNPHTGRLRPGAPPVETGPSPHGAVVTPDQGPRAALRLFPRSGVVPAGRPLLLDARRSGDPDGRISHYRWRFGDGRTLVSARPVLHHRYRRPGHYKVRLMVTDDEGCSARRIYTGQTASCNGGRRAIAVRRVTVRRGG